MRILFVEGCRAQPVHVDKQKHRHRCYRTNMFSQCLVAACMDMCMLDESVMPVCRSYLFRFLLESQRAPSRLQSADSPNRRRGMEAPRTPEPERSLVLVAYAQFKRDATLRT